MCGLVTFSEEKILELEKCRPEEIKYEKASSYVKFFS